MTGAEVDIPQAPEPVEWTQRATQVVIDLQRARDWLVEQDNLGNVVEFHAKGRALELYAEQARLGKTAELAACEIVRRAERRIAFLVEQGQRNGTLRTVGKHAVQRGNITVGPEEATGMAKATLHNVRQMAAGTDEDFEEAIVRARRQEKMTRTAVIRELTAVAEAEPEKPPPPKRPPRNYRKPGDPDYKKRHLPASAELLAHIVSELGAIFDAPSFDLIRYEGLDPAEVDEWDSVLVQVQRRISKLRKDIHRG